MLNSASLEGLTRVMNILCSCYVEIFISVQYQFGIGTRPVHQFLFCGGYVEYTLFYNVHVSRNHIGMTKFYFIRLFILKFLSRICPFCSDSPLVGGYLETKLHTKQGKILERFGEPLVSMMVS